MDHKALLFLERIANALEQWNSFNERQLAAYQAVNTANAIARQERDVKQDSYLNQVLEFINGSDPKDIQDLIKHFNS